MTRLPLPWGMTLLLPPELTEREIQVARAVAQGKQNKVIAYELGMAEPTAKQHLKNIMRKLGLHNRTQVALAVSKV